MGKVEEEMEDEDLDGVDLYKGHFSLAYGTLTLLRDAKMHLKQNRFYGLLGPNQCGKTTLMRAIVGEKLEGFPKQDELKSVFVEHSIYIMWRFAGNDDKESLEFATASLSVDEESARARKWCIDAVTGEARLCITEKEDPKKAKQDEPNAVVPDAVLNRKQLKKEKTFTYEVKWQFKPIESNTWVEKTTLIKMGYKKLVEREDEKQAAMAGLMTKQLPQPGVEQHLINFGVDAESASHTQLSQLSGGMKVKVVLAASMWQNPHILILDEPTNYLDRDGLGALVLAIRDYEGGVLIISHNKEFCDGVATEKWIMNKGYLRIEGESVDTSGKELDGNKGPEVVYDGARNKIEVAKKLTEKEKKKAIKDLEKQIKDQVKKGLLSDDEKWEMDDQLQALKDSLVVM